MVFDIIDKFYQDINTKKIERNKIESKIKDFLKNSQELLAYYPKESNSSESCSTKDILSPDLNKFNNDNDNEKQKNKSNKEIKGDFDVVIPNVEKNNFLKILEDNFYSKRTDKCIIYDKGKINNLPKYFNLFIEVGMIIFVDSYKHKIQQIKKYMAIINFSENIIENEIIRNIYKKDFQSRFYLHLNANNHRKAETSVYMLITNNTYGEFTRRFLDERNSLNLNNNAELNSIVPKSSKEVLLCGFVDFPKILNSYREYEKIKKIDDQLKQMDAMKKELKRMDAMKKELDELKLLIRNSVNNNNLGHNNNVDIANTNNYYS